MCQNVNTTDAFRTVLYSMKLIDSLRNADTTGYNVASSQKLAFIVAVPRSLQYHS